MTDDREDFVYGFSKSSKVYNSLITGAGSICFFGGEKGLGIPQPDLGRDPGDYYLSLLDSYADYGFEDNIGRILKDLLQILKAIDNKSVKQFLIMLTNQIRTFKHATENEKVDLLEWLK